MKRTLYVVPLLGLALVGCQSTTKSGGSAPQTAQSVATTTTAAPSPVVVSSAAAPAPVVVPTVAAPAPTAAASPTSHATTEQKQAVLAAKNYLAVGSGFSRQGLIDQLSSSYGSGFSVAVATAAVDSLGADWNAQAVISAKNYLSIGTGFSHASLVSQLDSPYGAKFTPAQAEYGATHAGD